MSNAVDELCALLDSIGATLTLYGQPVSAEEVSFQVERRAVARFLTGDPLNAERGPDLDAMWQDDGGEG